MQLRMVARIVAIALAGAAYIAGSHWLMTHTEASAWNVVGVLSPMLILVAIGGLRSGHRWVGAAALLCLAALCVQALLGVKASSHALYLAQHAGINFFLALAFGSTLRPGRTAIITTVALRVHGGYLPPRQLQYTRALTRAWVIFFLLIVAISLALYAWASFEAWALFANLITPIATGVMFGGEHLLRYRLHPEFERASVAEAVRAYMQAPKASGQSPTTTAP
ncbi:hypothetical protein ACVNIS_02650 [Sphaerotilaceae bacterium SBD11-9]